MAEQAGLAITCWHCGAQVPLRRVMALDGQRSVICPKCGKANSLDRPGGTEPQHRDE
jgi:hypothetical protein